MRFGRAKLSPEKIKSLRKVSAKLFHPYTVMITPVYMHLPLNEKLVALKGPLGIFFPDEIKRLEKVQDLFLPEFVDQVRPFHEAGEAVRKLLNLAGTRRLKTNQGQVDLALPL